MVDKQNEKGKMIVVCGAKGGIGKTLITVNLAIALNKKNISVNVLDADFQFGDVSLAMDLQPTVSIKDVIDDWNNVDSASFTSYLTEHSSGVHVLPSPDRPEYAELITKDKLVPIIELLQEQSDFLIVDTGIGIQEQNLDLIELADELFVVTTLEMTALKNTRLMLETLEKLGLREKIKIVVNRYDMDSLIEAEEVPNMLGVQEVIYTPNNFPIASQSLNLGIPFVVSRSRSNLSKEFFNIAERVISNNYTASAINEKKKQSLLKRFKK